jgi:hypothetical protein
VINLVEPPLVKPLLGLCVLMAHAPVCTHQPPPLPSPPPYPMPSSELPDHEPAVEEPEKVSRKEISTRSSDSPPDETENAIR